jgi:hypothetical protein
VTHFEITQSKLVATVPKQRQLVVLYPPFLKPTTYELNGFTTRQSGPRPGYFAATRNSDYIALSSGPQYEKKTDLINVRDGSVLHTINPRELKPLQPELQTMEIDDKLLVAVERGRLYWIKWDASGWSQAAVPNGRDDYKTDSFALTRATGRVFMGAEQWLTSYNLRDTNELGKHLNKPRKAALEFAPDGESFWLDNGQQFDLKGREISSLALHKTGGGVTVSPAGDKLIIGNQLIELQRP